MTIIGSIAHSLFEVKKKASYLGRNQAFAPSTRSFIGFFILYLKSWKLHPRAADSQSVALQKKDPFR